MALLKRLVAEADVVLENFKPGTLERLGLGYEALRAVNPDVVMLSTNALGSSGPWSRWLGYGPIVRCVSGIASLWRYPDDELGVRRADDDLPRPLRRARVRDGGAGGADPAPAHGGAARTSRVAQAELILNQLADVFLATSLGASDGDPARRGASTRAPATTSGASSRSRRRPVAGAAPRPRRPGRAASFATAASASPTVSCSTAS